MAEVWEIYDINGDGKVDAKDKTAFNKLSPDKQKQWRTNPLGMSTARDKKKTTKEEPKEDTTKPWDSLGMTKEQWFAFSKEERQQFKSRISSTIVNQKDPLIQVPGWFTDTAGPTSLPSSQLLNMPFTWSSQGEKGMKKINRLSKVLFGEVRSPDQILTRWQTILTFAASTGQGIVQTVNNPFIKQLLAATTAGKGFQPYKREDIVLTSRADANDILTQTMIEWLDRAPTKAEKDQFFKRLTTLQNKRPDIVKGVSKTKTIRTPGGVDPAALARKFVLKKLAPDQDLDGTLGVIQDNLMTLAERNGLVITQQEMLGIMKKIAKGASYESYKAEFNERAAKKYTALADALRNNPDATVYDLASEYIRDMANILEIDPNQITLKDVEKAIAFVGPDGKQRTLAGWEWKQMLREDPRFQYTTTARGEASSMATAFARAFGVSI